MEVKITPMLDKDLAEVVEFTDKWIGKNYFSKDELKEVLEKGTKDGKTACLLAWVGDDLAGARLTYAPGHWIDETTRGLSPDIWRVEENRVGYFKSLFVSSDFQKMGIGGKLSRKSIEILKEMGAQAILCHSWLESPGNSSQLYLQKMGFDGVNEFPKFWYEVDYHCTRCGPDRCVCTAMEMIKYLE